MRRTLALFAATLVLGVQALAAALPIGDGTAPGSGCAAGMPCCDVPNACSSREVPSEAPSCHGAVTERSDVPCFEALGCGHSLPGVAGPSLDPLVLQPPVTFRVATVVAPWDAASHVIPDPFHSEPSPPPPRA